MLKNLLGKGKGSLKHDPDKIWRSRELEFKGLLTFIKSIRRAQEKIHRQVAHPIPANSAEQWFQQNLPARA